MSYLFDWGFTTSITSLFAGNVINLFLYGVLTVQFYLYYLSFPRDAWLLKTVVYVIYVTETVHTILLIYDFGNLMINEDSTMDITLIVVPVGGGIVAFLTQATYAYRLRVLSQIKSAPWCILALIVANLIVIIVLALNRPLLPILARVWASISLVVDTSIASIMIWSLTKNKILSKQLKSKVTRLVYLTIGTGALTGMLPLLFQSIVTSERVRSAAIYLVTLILFALKSPAVTGVVIVVSKLYANSMMVFLNDRIPSGHRGDGRAVSEMVTGGPGSIRFATAPGQAQPVQEQLALDGCDEARSSGRMPSKIT